MMGRKGLQAKWFYNFSLEQRVPRDHLLRVVAKVIDFSFVRDLVRDTYSHTNAPSVDPVVVFKMVRSPSVSAVLLGSREEMP